MKSAPRKVLLLLALLCPVLCFAQNEAAGLHFQAEVLSFFNIIILITSLIGIKQFFWPSDMNYSPFHLINILMCLAFYFIGLSFLISHKAEYIGYEHLTSGQCITKFFFSFDIDSFKQWVIIFGMVINVCYIVRKRRDII